MNKKSLFATISILLLSMFATMPAFGHTIGHINEIIVATIGGGGPANLDPAAAYDTASGELIANVYDTLIKFHVDYTNPDVKERGEIDTFDPGLALEWLTEQPPAIGSPGYTNQTWYFKIRCNATGYPVKFQPATGASTWLTIEDVEYSFERVLVQDYSGGPGWMLYEPLLGVHGWDGVNATDWAQKMEDAVQHNATHVWFNLYMPYAPFYQILAQTWASIVNKAFCVNTAGDWPAYENGSKWFWPAGDWTDHHDPAIPPLDNVGDFMCGAGPYKLDYWTHGAEWSIIRHQDYWGGWPAPNCDYYTERATVKEVATWASRFAGFTATLPLYDMVAVPRANIHDLDPYIGHGIDVMWPLPSASNAHLFFTYNVSQPASSGNNYIGSGALDGNGIPPNFFNDTHMRKGFAYCFNWTQYIEEVYLNEAQQVSSCVIDGLLYYNNSLPKYAINLATAKSEFMLAGPGMGVAAGTVWTTGFKMVIAYNSDNVARRTAAEMMEANVETVFNTMGGGPVDISVLSVTWATYLDDIWNDNPNNPYICAMPCFILGWLADFFDPHNFVMPFLHSNGDFSGPQNIAMQLDDPATPTHNESSANIDYLVDTGIRTPNGPVREAIYDELQYLNYLTACSLPLVQATGRHYERDYIGGWYYNPLYPGGYYYHLWNEVDRGDLNDDGTVDVFDLVVVAGVFGTSPGGPPYHIADVNRDGTIDIFDIVAVAGVFG